MAVTTDRLAAGGCVLSLLIITIGLALIWVPLAIVVAGVLLGGMMLGAAVAIAASRTRGPEA